MTPGLQHPRKCCCPRASPSGNNTSSGVAIPGVTLTPGQQLYIVTLATTVAAPVTTTTPATIITTPATISVTPATTTASPTMVTLTATPAATAAAAPAIAAPVMAAVYPIRTVVTTRSMVYTKPRHPQRGNLLDLLPCPTKCDKLGTMTICLINAQSVRNKVSSLCDFISDHDFDILTMTETWLRDTPGDNQIIRALTMPGYTFTHVPRRQHTNTTARGGGVAIMHKSNIKMTSKSSWKAKSFENIEVTLSSSSTVKLVVIYRPPPSKRNKSTVGLFLSEFQDFLQHHMIKSRNILIVGYFNFHYEDPLNADASRFSDILSTHSLSQHVSGPTHMEGHTLDLVITKSTDNLVSNTAVSDFLTYHGAVHCCLHLPKPQPLRHPIQYRSYAAIDKHVLRGDIATSTLCLDPATSAASLLEQYDTTLSLLLDKHAPVLTRTITIRPKVLWFNGDTKMAKQKRRQLERRWRQSRLTIHRDLFKEQRRHVNQLIASAKSAHYTAKITEAACDIKQLYNVVNALLIKPEHGLSDCGSMHQLANKFSAFFQDKIRMIQENLTLKANPNYVPEDNPDAVDNTLSVLVPATEDEIRGQINKSPSTSSSLDPVPTWLLKEYLTCLLPTITNIVNLSMSTGIVPTARKVRS